MVIMLYITFPGLIYFIPGNFYLFTTFTHLACLSFLASGSHQSVLSMSYVFFFFFQILHTSEIIQYLSVLFHSE